MGFLGLRSPKKPQFTLRKEDFEGEHNVAFKRGQRVLAHFAERSNEKKLNAKITLLDGFIVIANTISRVLYLSRGLYHLSTTVVTHSL